jgi:hypothetical protein
MGAVPFQSCGLALIGFVAALVVGPPAQGAEPRELERNLVVSVDGEAKTLSLEEAMAVSMFPRSASR